MQMTLVQNLPCKFHGDSRKDITLEVRGKFQLHALSTFSFSINHKYLWIMCILCTPRPIYRSTSRLYRSTSQSTYRPTLDRCISRHISRVSTDVLVDISVECWSICRPMYQPRYRPSDGQHIDRLSADISVEIVADTRPICWPLIVGGISVNRRWYISQKLRLLVYKLYAFHQKFLKASCSAFMCGKFSRYQARHSSEILSNTQNTVDRKEDKDNKG